MAQSPNQMYPGKVITDPAFTDGKYKNSSDPSLLDGTPIDEVLNNQNLSWQDALMAQAGIAYSGALDTPSTSQLFQAMLAAIGSGTNYIQNHNFTIATTDDSQPRPDATPRSYAPDYQVFAGWYADPVVGVTDLTYINGVINFTAGALYQDVDMNGGLDNATGLIASLAGTDGKPVSGNVTFSTVSSAHRVVIASGSSNVFSCKFEQNPFPTRHQPYGSVGDFQDPIGTLKFYAGDTAPIGYLEVRLRADLSPWPKLEALLPGGIPETRGEFLRVWDNGRGINPSQGLLEWAEDTLQDHGHQMQTGRNDSSDFHNAGANKGHVGNGYSQNFDAGDGWVRGVTQAGTYAGRVGTETKPRSLAAMLIIRAA